MKRQSSTNTQAAFGHAVVIGSSIAGLTAARILSDHFDRVTLIERDRLPATPDFRRGAPQGRHAHLLLPPGQAVLEQLFPGLNATLLAAGATFINSDPETPFFLDGAWHDDLTCLSCSRPLLESTLYQRLAAHPSVRILQGYDVLDLLVDPHRRHVSGVRLRRRGSAPNETSLPAQLVIDASGRGSRAPQWLANLGYTPPRETIIDPFTGYTTRIYRRSPGFAENWNLLRVRRTPPDGTRGGLISPIEGDRWYVTLIGMSHDYPPTDAEGFLDFARSLPSPRIYEAIQGAEPLSSIYGFRNTQNRLRHYDELPHYLEGFLVCGDAACAVSPVHAQGMTSALLGLEGLADCLAEQRSRGSLAGLAQTFQQRLRQATQGVWKLIIADDLRWPATLVTERPAGASRLHQPGLASNLPTLSGSTVTG
ncbi:MAG: 2-polyprenyl-6-methoxyphenol hydroxylase-like oxidoreductase [Anaerolineales bacterium]|nr:2-polyprenyl-6-methoxyphenol hydroxylase-like oxidoreductase [Anaerolineales bacterium]